MPAANHPAYAEELERCRDTLGYVERSLKKALQKKEKIGKELDNVRKHSSSDSSADYVSNMVNSMIHDSLVLKVRNLYSARSKPYFARIDFIEDDSNKLEKLYIGKMSLARDEDQEIIIVDWRAPIANLYYEGRLGHSAYVCPNGSISGELKLKRQISINNGTLEEIFDIDITTNDEFLQSYLGANAENRLKEIVSTIQEEQNAIVRADMWKPLIIQGVAGSGKTTIALHRIAYLIYMYEKRFVPENFMIIAPNRLFLNYISEVLPELGVERVKQTTFEDFAQELIGKKFKITDSNEKLNLFVNYNVTDSQIENNKLLRQSSILKTSMVFKYIIDEYISIIEKDFIPKEDFILGKKVVMSYQKINDLFINEFGMWPIAIRLNELKKSLATALKKVKQVYLNQIHSECDFKIERIKSSVNDEQEKKKMVINLLQKRDEILEKLESRSKTAVKEYIDSISKLSPYQYYVEFLQNEELFNKVTGKYADPATCKFTREHTLSLVEQKRLEQEDLAPIIYLKFKIYGMDEKIPVKHIVIDEAQDFSAFQLYVIKNIIKDSSFTILGDLCQGIHSYRGIRRWEEVIEQVFDDRGCGYLTLEQSYRTTVEIMDAANQVISRLKDLGVNKGRPVIRHGEPVEIVKKDSVVSIAQDIIEKICYLKSINYKTIAIICKTMEECQVLSPLLNKAIKDIYIITGNEKEYRSGVVIVPSYLSKGLEFDAVFIANANSINYKDNELDTKLLYVSMTRPLHQLIIYYHDELTPLLQ